MKLFERLFRKKKAISVDEDLVEWCIYDPDVVCDLFQDCQDCCYYEQWLKRGRKDIDTNFDEWNLDQGKFDFNHYDNEERH